MKNLKIIDYVQRIDQSFVNYRYKTSTKYEAIFLRKIMKFLFYYLLILFIFSINELSMWMRVLGAIFVLLYTRITLAKGQIIKNAIRDLKSFSLIYFDNTQKDLTHRNQIIKLSLRFILRCFISIIVIVSLVFSLKSNNHSFYFNNIQDVFMFLFILYLNFYFFCRLNVKISNVWGLTLLLIFTNPIFSLFILLVGLNYLGKLTNHIIFATNTEGFLYMLLQIGLEQKLIIFSLIYSLIFHLTYVFLQPAYKIEKSRLALETVTFGYAIISILGLAYSKDISKVLFEYLIITPYFGKDFFQAAQFSGFDTIASLSGFTSFFEKTFKLFLLPFTVCASLAMIIFKFREISSKNRANKYFQKAAFSQDISPNEQITLLKKALYYGGGTMKNAIVGHHFLYKVVPDLLLEPSNKPSLMRYWLRKLLVLYRYYRIKINNKKLLLSDRYQCIKAEFNDNKKFIKSLPIAKKIKLYFGIIFYFIFFLFICNSIKYVKYYSDLAGSYYLKILNNDIVLAYYWAFIVYTGVVCTILYKKAFHYSESKAVRVKIYKRKDIIRFTANFLWLVAMISTYIFDIIHQKWIVLIFLLCFVHIIWFLTITFENEKNNGL